MKNFTILYLCLLFAKPLCSDNVFLTKYSAPENPKKSGVFVNCHNIEQGELLREMNVNDIISKATAIASIIDSKRAPSQKKILSAILAFPFPFGFIGLHRIYLGSQPYVPLVYIATLGGALGILPLIDFIALLAHKNIEPFIGNDKIFMWIN